MDPDHGSIHHRHARRGPASGRPRLFATTFGSVILRGRSSATFEPEGDGTRITQTFETVGLMSAISSWVFSRGSYEGSFRGELEKFARLAEREAPPPSSEDRLQ